ncbi:PREDICTED: minor histocompatibility antigen H13 [Drosophila arizonae]|uniref:Minor histocompatibility antigen H13 n=1 Tax=Drosophila arizonae TaxID=7263 RepID=A0ABM1NU60_DROAR|nr:PREDICTED: minor histocompatibility antigen H13 [Drosophila arizonae]
MAEEVIGSVKKAIQGILENVNASAKNETITNEKKPSTPEGIAVAYSSLVIMAMLPIIFGSIRSVKLHKLKKSTGEKADTMTKKDAMYFPLIASVALFGLYMFFQIFQKVHINLLLTGYFFVLGVIALAHLLSPVVNSLMPAAVPKIPFHIHFTKGEGKHKEDIINYKFSTHDIICLMISSAIGVWYLLKKHWIANNMFGLAFAINGVEMLHLNNFVTGVILLSGLFFYDIFWVFGTNVMVTVAKSFEAPIKLVFPQDILDNGFNASNFAMLGLGDIVIPGIFIALLLRFDDSKKRKTRIYFYSTLTAYFMGLLATIFVMHVFKHAQPALLYLVPACMGTPLLVALVRGELKVLFAYEDHPEEKPEKKEKKEKDESGSSSSSKKKDSKKAK